MNTSAHSTERLMGMLASALGSTAGNLLEDPAVAEIILNSDGKLWVDRLGEGRTFTGAKISPADAQRVIFLVASHVDAVCNKENPILSAELPGTGSRFQGALPPIVANPSFTIRKHAVRVFSLDEWVEQGSLNKGHAEYLQNAVHARKNILIVGGTFSGKTTFANAILSVMADCKDRIVIIQDTLELQCAAEDCEQLRSVDGIATIRDCVRATMRMRPDRIVIGEVRGAEALELLKSWNTGHPGGVATLHADSAVRALSRLEQLIQEAIPNPSKQLIAESVNVIVAIRRTPKGRRVHEVVEVKGLDENGNYVYCPIEV